MNQLTHFVLQVQHESQSSPYPTRGDDVSPDHHLPDKGDDIWAKEQYVDTTLNG